MYRYIDSDGQEHELDGVADFEGVVRAGEVAEDTLVYSNEIGRWKQAGDLDVFRLAHRVSNREAVPTNQGRVARSARPDNVPPCTSCGSTPPLPEAHFCIECGEDLRKSGGWRVVGDNEFVDREFSVEQLVSLVERGKLDPNVRVMRNGMVNPVPMNDHRAFAQRLRTIPESTGQVEVGSSAVTPSADSELYCTRCGNELGDLEELHKTSGLYVCPFCHLATSASEQKPDTPQVVNVGRRNVPAKKKPQSGSRRSAAQSPESTNAPPLGEPDFDNGPQASEPPEAEPGPAPGPTPQDPTTTATVLKCRACETEVLPSDRYCPGCSNSLSNDSDVFRTAAEPRHSTRSTKSHPADKPAWGPFSPLLPRATRRNYLFWTVLAAIDLAVLEATTSQDAILVFGLLALILAGVQVVAGVGRLHDTGNSGWWIALAFVPIVNLGLGLYLLFAEPAKGENEYGPDPRGRARA